MHRGFHWAVRRYLWFWATVILRARKPFVIGITGSVGKTTTKELIAAVLSGPEVAKKVGLVWKTPENFNDNIGVPLSVLGADYFPTVSLRGVLFFLKVPFRAVSLAWFRQYPRVLVIEFGAGAMGDIGYNASRVRPDIGVITAIGPAHLTAFESVEGVADAKAALVEKVPENGLVIFGEDNPFLAEMAGRAKARVVVVEGRHEGVTVGIARAVAQRLGVDSQLVEESLTTFQGVPGRFEVQDLGRILLIDDSFNANPLSMHRGLKRFGEMRGAGRRCVAILGWMAELGSRTEAFHRDIAPIALESADFIVGVGELTKHYEPDVWFPSSSACSDALEGLLQPGDIVFVKGSHSSEVGLLVRGIKRLVRAGRITNEGDSQARG
jgi:UDP-N-acetylmuramoyl-tripeptide--D-alanyl-D-alanine ligase